MSWERREGQRLQGEQATCFCEYWTARDCGTRGNGRPAPVQARACTFPAYIQPPRKLDALSSTARRSDSTTVL
ncbi:hypothetical protein FA95DRAFT_1560361 [Auriscalpium vulgare]|uniref:Uncharacterized protein n=1 Tax=Auriscalpium vulgare TaxID=40419 RepID=A0ACB8RRP5_9AGAM|nr:hypothetical protein FA95DRAFT_1560361 [Auriscalpium vulgare]